MIIVVMQLFRKLTRDVRGYVQKVEPILKIQYSLHICFSYSSFIANSFCEFVVR